MKPLNRIAGALSRRLGRPELLAAVDPRARRSQLEEVAIRALLAGVLGEASTYVDAGTNRGQVLREAVRVAPAGRHLAFEPIPALAAEVAREFPGVECRPLALGARRETARFCHFTALDGWSGLRRSPEISDERGRPEYFDVQVSTLDGELEGVDPRVIKIDVEGAELAVLEGARGVLARARPLVIFEHVAEAARLYDASPEQLWDLLDGAGYRIFSVTGEGPFARGDFAAERETVNWAAAPARPV